MKNKLITLMLVAILVTTIPNYDVFAATNNIVRFKAYDESEYTYEDIADSPKLASGSVVKPGDVFRLDVDFESNGTHNISMFQYEIYYDKTLLEVVEVDDQDLIYPKDDEGGVFPTVKKGRDRVHVWTINHNIVDDLIIYTGQTVAKPEYALSASGPMMVMYFRVKADATPGKEIKFRYNKLVVADNMSNTKVTPIEADTSFKLNVAKEAGQPAPTLNGVSLKADVLGNSADGHDYLGSQFDEKILEYPEIVVPHTVTKIKEDIVLSHPDDNASFKFGKEKGSSTDRSLEVGDNTFLGIYAYQGETLGIYRFNVKRLDVKTSLDLIAQYEGENDKFVVYSSANPPANGIVKTQGSVDSLELFATAPTNEISYVSNGVIEGSKLTLNPTANTDLDVTVKSESGLKKYETLFGNDDPSIVKEALYKMTFVRGSKDTSLKQLKVGDTLVDLKKDERNYDVEIDRDTKLSHILMQMQYDEARVHRVTLNKKDLTNLQSNNTFESELNLIEGNNIVEIETRAEDGTKDTYRITLKRKQNDDATLQELSVTLDGKPINIAFNPETLNYDLGEIEFKENTKIKINASVDPKSGAKIENDSVLTEQTLTSGNHDFPIQIVSESGKKQTYILTVTMKGNSSSELTDGEGNGTNPFKPKDPTQIDDIKSDPKDGDGNPIDPNGQGDDIAKDSDKDKDGDFVYRYTVKVPNSKKTFSLDDLTFTLPANASIEADEPLDLVTGSKNTYQFIVSPEDMKQPKSKYILTIVRAYDSNAQLLELKASQGNFNKSFNPDTYEYVLTVDSNVKDVILSGRASEFATINQTMPMEVTLDSQSKEVKIDVVAENKVTKQTYTIKIEKKPSEINTLSVIKLDGKDITSEFVNNIYTSETSLSNDVEVVEIEIEKTDVNATVSFDGQLLTTNKVSVPVKKGKNTISFVVTSQTGSTRVYTLNVMKDSSANADLALLSVEGTPVPGFSSDTLSYTLDPIASDTSSLNIEAKTLDANATVTINGNQNLKAGQNKIEITVTAEDNKTKKVYEIHVERLTKYEDKDIEIKDPVISIDKDTEISNPEPNHYYYVAYVPRNLKEFTDKHVHLSDAKLEEGYQISKFYKNPLPLSDTEKNEFKFDLSTQSNEHVATIHIDVRKEAEVLPTLKGISLNGKNVSEYKGESSFEINVDPYLKDKNPKFDLGLVLDDGIEIIESVSQKVDMTGKQTLVKTIVLTDSKTAKTNLYEFTFTRSLSDDARLQDMKITYKDKDGNIKPLALNHGIDEEPFDLFEIEHVPSDVEEIMIDVTPKDALAHVIKGQESFKVRPGKNVFTVRVQPEDASAPAQVYQILVNKDIELTSLKLGTQDIDVASGKYDAQTNTMTYQLKDSLDANSTIQNLKAVANDSSVKWQGQVNKDLELKPGKNTFNFTALAYDGEAKVNYVLEVSREASHDATLKSLSLKNKELKLTPEFKSDVMSYVVEVPQNIDTWGSGDVIAEANHTKTNIFMDSATIIKNAGDTIYRIKTESESKETLTYELILRKVGYNYLSDLHIGQNQGMLSPMFNPEIQEYEATLFPGVENFRVYYTLDDKYEARILNPEALENIEVSSLPRTIEVKVEAKNGEIRTYSIHAKAGLSTRLSALNPDKGDLTPTFNSSTLEYELKVLEKDLSISFDPKTEDPNAKILGTFENVPLLPNTTNINMVVTNGNYQSVYTVRVVKEKDKTAIDSITVKQDGHSWPGTWNEETQQYEVSVPSDTNLNTLLIDAKLADKESKFKVNDPKIEEDKVTYVVTVTTKDGQEKNYEFVVNREASDNNYLKSIHINHEALLGFEKTIQEYQYENRETKLDVVAISEHEKATVEIIYPKESDEKKVVTIHVTSQSKQVRTYQIEVQEKQDESVLLQKLSVKEGNINPKFNPLQNDYYLTIPYELDAITPIYESNDDATVEIKNQNNIPVGSDHVVEVSVNTKRNQTNTYRIHVTRTAQSNNVLEKLTVEGENHGNYKLTPEFNPKTNVFVVDVVDDHAFEIEATASESMKVSGTGNITVTDFPYNHEVRVVGENNIPRIYTIQFNQKPSSEKGLQNLWTDKGHLDPVFSADKTAYNIDVDADVKTIEVFATAIDAKQKVSNLGIHALQPGRNTLEIESIAEDGSKRVYTLFVNRAHSNTFGLDSLKVSEGELSPSFDKEIKTYYVNVDEAISSIDISAMTNNQDAKITGTGSHKLELGSNTFPVKVTRNRNEEATYYVIVNRGDVKSNALAHLDLKDIALNPSFKKDVLAYTADVHQKDKLRLNVNAIPEDPQAKVTIDAPELKVGKNTITITVTREDMEARKYTVEINVKELKLESEIHVIGDVYIETIHEKQTVLDVKNQMLNENETLAIYREGRVLEDQELVGTGAIIKLIVEGVEYDEKTLIVKGDVNGDGRIGVADVVNLRTYILGGTLNDAQKVAADTNHDKKVGVADLILIRSHILGSKNLFEK
ncbi:cadherin-like beta sandwich domain-containing protein [Erysipelothrix inopinata]|uniref:Cadherin-like beta sandwich domain-containing protein n=1 Tax=Erysipelothrix inopinata TaxID=225084 RepID=A0A7G9RYF5_9FIRM|nr:cadherin-like beta sandwich domain-containing protein [Erysipelothrix inopinata]QNN60630.1 cadherin-like beta sandwich domain-containing protein [Erysipelothrix inopinata]